MFFCRMNIYIYMNHDVNILMKIIIYNFIVSLYRFFDALQRHNQQRKAPGSTENE